MRSTYSEFLAYDLGFVLRFTLSRLLFQSIPSEFSLTKSEDLESDRGKNIGERKAGGEKKKGGILGYLLLFLFEETLIRL